MSIRILLADDHRIMREGLRALLESHPGMTVLAEAENGRRAVELARNLKPDVVIMDVTMPDLNGIEATRQITHLLPEVRIIALSIHSDRRFVLEMFKAGAAGYLLKDCAFEELTRAIRAVADGQAYLSPEIAGSVMGLFLRGLVSEGSQRAKTLSGREREVVQLLSEGRTTKEVAGAMGLSVKTVETHRRNLMEKLGVGSVAELTKYAIREGITTLEK